MTPMMFGDYTSKGGYACGEVASALQKTIRRGDEEAALFWATELDISGYGAYVWKRLRIISSEDVGIADPLVCVQVRALYDNWLEQRKLKDVNNAPERLYLVHAVILLARAKKSRMVDHALITFYEGERPKPPIPDYALDKHTRAGRKLKRGVAHFFAEGAVLANAVYFGPHGTDPYEVRAFAARSGQKAPATEDLFSEEGG